MSDETLEQIEANRAFASRMHIQAPSRSERKVSDLVTREPFSTLFPIKPEDLEQIRASISKHKYDPSQPIDIWFDGENEIVVDGHTRLEAAKQNHLLVIPVNEYHFLDERGAFDFALSKQRDRRNLTKEEQRSFYARAIEVVEGLRKGGDRGNQYTGGKVANATLADTAELLGIPETAAKDISAVLNSDDEELREDVLSGKKGGRSARKELSEKRKQKPPTVNMIQIGVKDLPDYIKDSLLNLLEEYVQKNTAKLVWDEVDPETKKELFAILEME